MALEFIDKIERFIPSIKGPSKPLSLREKMYWTGGIIAIYFLLYNTYAVGVNQNAISAQPFFQLMSIVFASKIGSLITVGIGPIVLASIVLQLIVGSDLIKIDLNNPIDKARFQTLQKLLAIIIAVVESIIYISTSFVPIASPSAFWLVAIQLAIGAILIIFLDEMMTKYGVTSGINMFIASGVAYAIIAGTITILLPGAIAALNPATGGGGAAALPNAVLVFGPFFFAIIILLVSIYAYEMKVELPLSFEQFRGIGGRLPIPFLYVSVLPVILASSLELSLTIWFRFLANISGSFANLAHFFAYYQTIGGSPQLVGGLIYLISPSFPSPFPAPFGVGGYGPYIHLLLTSTSTLYLPTGGFLLIPEWVHAIIYTLVLMALCVVFGKFWIEMTGQSSKNMAEQMSDIGWQIPGFRRDPRIIENVLNKYIPTITVLGSLFVGFLAAIATLTGAIGTGMGILLTVGIIYMLYEQLKQESLFETYPILEKIAK
ncbi:MAG: preprotein translocase subunit SecY [Candidatus Micrarchaeia archaeon]